MESNRVFFITGCSKGFGLLLSKLCLQKGYCVASTSRNVSELIKSIDNKYILNGKFIPLDVDITNEDSVKKAVDKTIQHFGKIDVLINNAGYSLVGSLEELSNKEIKEIYDCNVFGLINVIRQILPHYRTCDKSLKKIVNISSVVGIYGRLSAFSIYSSTKFAVEAITEGLQEDVKEFGIHVSSILPGYFKTTFFKPDSMRIPSNPIKEYTKVRETIEYHQNMGDKQLGDPLKGCEIIIQHSLSSSPSHHLFLGSDALQFVDYKLNEIQNDIKSNYNTSISTDTRQIN